VGGGRLCFDYNLGGRHTVLRSAPLATGTRALAAELSGADGAVQLELAADGARLGATPLPMAFPAGFGLLSSQCGMNDPSPVSPDYAAPFRFSGGLEEVVVTLGEADPAAAAGLWAAALRAQ
jgi:hypothetical protein